jgi:hypothetical protein
MIEDTSNPLLDFIAKITELDPSEIKGKDLAAASPLLLPCLITGALSMKGTLDEDKTEDLKYLVFGLWGVFMRSHGGDKASKNQLNVLRKFIFPKTYEVPISVIEALAKKYESGHITRGLELRKLMHKLSEIVIPSRHDSNNPFEGPIQLLPASEVKDQELYKIVQECWHRKTTLQSLAIHIYLREKQNQGKAESKIDERTLKRDLHKLRQWEEADEFHISQKEKLFAAGGGDWRVLVPIYKYSETTVPVKFIDETSSQDSAQKTSRKRKRHRKGESTKRPTKKG